MNKKSIELIAQRSFPLKIDQSMFRFKHGDKFSVDDEKLAERLEASGKAVRAVPLNFKSDGDKK